jgi:excisionase family DNA binding protein
MKLLTTKEAAEMLGVKPSTLQKWRYRGVGPGYVRLSHKNVRYSSEELAKYIKEKSQ